MQRQGAELSALTVNYGQSHAREIEAARHVARTLGVEHRRIEAPFFAQLAAHSSLTHPAQHPHPVDRTLGGMADEVPITYVPLRNTYLLTLAAAALESRTLEMIETYMADPGEVAASIVIGANAIDYSGYPDCRPEYYRAAVETFRLGSKLGTIYEVPLKIATPLIEKTKADIVRLAFELGVPIGDTWSCYGPGPTPCGRCDSCLLRAKGFRDAGVTDPALTRSRAEA